MKIRNFIFLFLVFILVPFSQGCRSLFVNSPEKKAAKRQEKLDREFDKNYAKIRKAHFKNQTRKTRQRMKKSRREARKINKPRKTKSKKDCL